MCLRIQLKKIYFLVLECARNYTAPQGRLYGKSLSDCEQYITVPENNTITLYFAALDFRTSQECTETKAPLAVSQLRMDYIFVTPLNLNIDFWYNTKKFPFSQIYDGRNNGLLKFYCSDTVPQPLFTTTNQLRLKYQNVTLTYVMNELYDITYLATDKGSFFCFIDSTIYIEIIDSLRI